MNELVKGNGALGGDLSTTSDYVSMYKKIASAAGPTVGRFLKFTKDGRWVLGIEQEVITEDQLVCVNYRSLKHGVIGWLNGEPVHNELKPLNEAIPTPEEMQRKKPIHPTSDMDGYYTQYSLQGIFVADKLDFQYSGSSDGCKKFMLALINALGEGIPVHMDYPNPVLSLTVESYVHKTYGKTYKPGYHLL